MNLDFFKRNPVIVACGVVAVVALFLVFVWPLSSMRSDLQDKLEKRKKVHDQARALLNKSRMLPVVSLDDATQERLVRPDGRPRFPSQEIISAGEHTRDQMRGEAERMHKLAVQINTHKLLLPESLPRPREPVAFAFRDIYQTYLRETLPREMEAGRPPDEIEVKAAQDKLRREKFEPQLIIIDGRPTNQAEVDKAFAVEARRLAVDMVGQRAVSSRVYLSPDALPMAQNIVVHEAPDPLAIWHAQVGLWILQDLRDVINAVNGGTQRGVLTAPIKHLIKVDAPTTFVLGAPAGQQGGPTGEPGDTQARVSPTGRVSNRLYDVLHFSVQMHVEAQKIPQLIQEFGRNRFLTVYHLDVGTVDSAAEAARGYIYGPQPVARVTAYCELLLLRDWTSRYMPEKLKAHLGIK